MKVPKAPETSRTFKAVMTVIGLVVGCGLTVLSVTWIAAGRIEYWTGPNEFGHVVFTPESAPVSFWLLIFACGGGAIVLWCKLLGNLFS